MHSIDDVQRFHILLVPRPPEFSTGGGSSNVNQDTDEGEMNLVQEGADAVPAKETTGEKKKHFRLVAVGKKQLPDPEAGGGKGGGRKATFWATVVTVGEDLQKLQDGLGRKEYETKTKGEHHASCISSFRDCADALKEHATKAPHALLHGEHML